MSSSNHSRTHRDPSQHATAIAQAVDTAWSTSNHSGRRDVALSVVAGLALVGPRAPDGPDLAGQLRAQDVDEFINTLRTIYTAVVNARPDLTHLTFPLMDWLFNESQPALQRAAKHTADAALGAGQLELTGTDDRYDTDLLGVVLTLLKSKSAGKANAQIYTPAPLAELMAQMTMPEKGSSVCDPTVGTGGLFRATAQTMRRHDHDPATITWYGADIDDLAIAACAINSILWGLGPRVVLCVADTLTEPDWADRASAQRDELIQIAETTRQHRAMVESICDLQEGHSSVSNRASNRHTEDR